MSSKDAGVLVNILGFITGAGLYLMLLVMVLRSRLEHYQLESLRGSPKLTSATDHLPLFTAVLGLLWNLGALAAYGLPELGLGELSPILTATAFTALGLLPAVVVHSALKYRQAFDGRRRATWLLVSAYSVSVAASFLHFKSAVLDNIAPSPRALLLLTLSFGAVIVALLVVTQHQPDRSRTLWVAALAIFAVSALHLSHHEGEQYSWYVELIGHHASLPLALAILYQDYRFALADIFLKRVISLVVLVALASGLYLGVAYTTFSRIEVKNGAPLAVVGLLTMWVATALAYPALRRAVGIFVDKIVLRRPDYDALRGQIARLAAESEDAGVMLDGVCALLAPALSARETSWIKLDESTDPRISGATSLAQTAAALRENRLSKRDADVEADALDRIVIASSRSSGATVLIPTAEPPSYALIIGELSAGRRLLSDDVSMLEAVAFVVARQLDKLRITHERCEQTLREQEISKLVTEAELRALRAQINPHFLFNALTTIGYLIQTAPANALGTLMRLTELLRAVLRPGGEFVTLGEEITLIESYLDIERARFEERLRTSFEVPESLRSIRIPTLLIQPLVENAIKHGIAPCRGGGEVIVSAQVEDLMSERSAASPALCITVRDTGAGASDIEIARARRRGLGIANVEQRLNCYYGSSANLSIKSARGLGTKVEVWLPLPVDDTPQDEALTVASERRRPA